MIFVLSTRFCVELDTLHLEKNVAYVVYFGRLLTSGGENGFEVSPSHQDKINISPITKGPGFVLRRPSGDHMHSVLD